MPRPISRTISSSPVQQSQVRSLAPAVAQVAESLAGRVRYLYELATGTAAVADDGIVTPLNPQGRAGVDHSGPPWGDALQHPVWVWEGSVSSANYYGERAIMSFGSTSGEVQYTSARFVVRPFHNDADAPYSRLLLRVGGIRTGGASNATASIRVYGPEGNAGPSRSTTLTMASTSALSFAAPYTFGIEIGYNERLIEIESTANIPFDIVTMSLNQVVRRSH